MPDVKEAPSAAIIEAIQRQAAEEASVDNYVGGMSSGVELTNEKPVVMYELEARQPLVTDLLELTGFYNGNLQGSKEKLALINEYIMTEIERVGMRPIVGSYKEIFQGIQEMLGISTLTDRWTAMNKMYVFLKAAATDRKKFRRVGVQYGVQPTLKDLSLEELKTLLN